MRKNKHGISLIVLVITIIIMIILAATIIISLENTGIIGAAENAVCMTNIKQAQNLAVLVWSNIYTNPDEYTMDNVEDKLREEFEKNGLKYEDYNVEVTKNGINVSSKAGCTDSSGVEGGSGDTGSDTIPTNWVYAYSYNRTSNTWNPTLNEGTEPTGDIVVRLYKNGTMEYEGATYDMFDMIVSGTGEFDFTNHGGGKDPDSDGDQGSENEFTVDVEGEETPVHVLVKYIEIQEGITSIAMESLAYEYPFLQEVKLASTVKSIGDEAFGSATSLEKINLENVEQIENRAFAGCTSLNNIVLSNTLKTIESQVFVYCSGLTGIVIPDSVTVIKEGAFKECTSLKVVQLPLSVNTIGGTSSYDYPVFEDCTALEKINYTGTKEQWNAISGISEVPETATVVYNYTGN